MDSLMISLSDRDHQILDGLRRFGFLAAHQIQRLWFDHPDASPLGATRRTQRVLRRLSDHGLIERLPRRQGGVRGGSGGFTYRLSPRGHRALGLISRGSYRPPSERFVEHCLAIAEIATGLVEAEHSGRIESLQIVTEPDTWRRFQTPGGVVTLKPDLAVDCIVDGWDLRWFIEADRATEHLPTIVAKARLYERYWRSGREDHPVFPRVLWSTPTERRADQIADALRRTRSLTPDLFATASAAETVRAITSTNDISKGGQS
jgi:hypothetical protein